MPKKVKFKTIPKTKISSTQIPKTKISSTQIDKFSEPKDIKKLIELKKKKNKSLLRRAKQEAKLAKLSW